MSRLTRAAALAAAAVLALGVLPASWAQAADDPSGATAAAGYLSGNLVDGLLTYQSFGFDYTDFGGSIDAELELAAVGGHTADVTSVGHAIDSRLADYTDFSYTYQGHDYAGRSAGSTAKAVVALQTAEIDPTTATAGNLVTRLENMVSDASGTEGRIVGDSTKDGAPDPADDFVNTFGQEFAVQALATAQSSRALSATNFLLEQQCTGPGQGYFREDLSAIDASVQTCDGDASSASVDATAQAIESLLSQLDGAGTSILDMAAQSAATWLIAHQNVDGSFSGTVPNANTTGLAVKALADFGSLSTTNAAGVASAVAKGATWLRAHQLDNVGTCTPYAGNELGAVAYDDAALTGAESGGITVDTRGQFIKATTQAADALLSAPAAGTLTVAAPKGYVADGTTQKLKVSGAAPGSSVCLDSGGVAFQRATSAAGDIAFSVSLPRRSATTKYLVTGADGSHRSVSITSLAAKKLGLDVRQRVAAGSSQKVVVTRLAPHEKVTVKLAGKRVRTGTASARGRYTTTFKVTGRHGKQRVVVVGQFADRRAAKKFTVTK